MNEEIFGGAIFGKIETDPRINPELRVCLYCKITNKSKVINYQIPLDSINEWAKQCPACNAIYIIKSPLYELE